MEQCRRPRPRRARSRPGRTSSTDCTPSSLLIGIIGAATVFGSFLIGWPSLIAVILNYVKRSEARGTGSIRISAGRSGRSGSDCCGSRSVCSS